MAYFPFFIDIENQDCLIIGGGTVALRKVEVLLGYGPRITVIAPAMVPELAELADTLKLETRPFQMKDLEERDFVIAATEDGELNRRVSDECRRQKIPVNVVDVKDECSFIFPSIVRDGDLVVGISSGGGSPTITQELKKSIRHMIPEGYGRLVKELGQYREYVKERVTEERVRTAIFRKMAEAGKENGCHVDRSLADWVIRQVLEEEKQ